uniref:Pseudouridine synthase like 1 n=1 Tax=Crocodylus porosus TaxID=8502 RepID=A0A7M4DWQ3_CROPO
LGKAWNGIASWYKPALGNLLTIPSCVALQKAAQNLKPLVPIKFCISSRPDAGVHALCNSAQVDIQKEAGKPPFPGRADQTKTSALKRILTLSFPSRILSACQVPDDFYACFSALSRTYIYGLVVGCSYNSQTPVFERDLCWVPRGYHLNVPAAQQAVQFLLGTPDFSTFRSICATTPPESPVKTFIHVDIRPFSMLTSLPFQGKLKPYHIKELLEASDSLAYPRNTTAPAAGLFLKSVEYDDAGK